MSDQTEQNKEVEGATSLMLQSITPGILSESPQPSTSVVASYRSLGGGPFVFQPKINASAWEQRPDFLLEKVFSGKFALIDMDFILKDRFIGKENLRLNVMQFSRVLRPVGF
ncbi:hypothetical protein NPIL_403091 [Nephila pilipes]|uniref:Uncharacterized protein n=1 Tax=Nephila pilipes TaxID=299642 RepID=A0A8X6URE7_NEPPI|nr:hypothetical protein NPIL_403091 [Nephila pilipes]